MSGEGFSYANEKLAEERHTITHWPTGNPGGHFVALHEPEALAADLRTFFAPLR